tara:strand:+ start:29237 stop:30655 length:1419 start_codon:yes stop_codon:yes gene_type:complete
MKLLYFNKNIGIITILFLTFCIIVCIINQLYPIIEGNSTKQKKKERTKIASENAFNWPSVKKPTITHTHPTLLYYNSNGDIVPVKHGHQYTERHQKTRNDEVSDTGVSLGSQLSYSKLAHWKYGDTTNLKKELKKQEKLLVRTLKNPFNVVKDIKTIKTEIKKITKAIRLADKNIIDKYHYSIPLPVDSNNNIIDLRKNINHLSPTLWKEVSDEDAEGYLYPYNISNRFNKDAIDKTMPYGEQIHDKLKYENPSDVTYFNGIEHTHKLYKDKGLAKGPWHLKKRGKKSAKKKVTKDMCVYETPDSDKYTVVRDGKKKRDKTINTGTTEKTLSEARNLVQNSNWSFCNKDTTSDSTTCECVPGKCSYNNYGGSGNRPLNACIYQGTCVSNDDSNSDVCSKYSSTNGTTGNKNSCESSDNNNCSWKYDNKDCTKYEDTETTQDTCSGYNVSDTNKNIGAAESACNANPWCYWGQ